MSALKITKANFEQEVLHSDRPVLLDFWAPWCGPCRSAGPVVDEIAGEVADKVKVGKVNVTEELDLAQSYGVSTIPTFIVIKEGKIVNKSVGFGGKQAILDLL